MNDNLIKDVEMKIKIPQNDITKFKIEKSITWKYMIDIYIQPKEKIDYFNLFLIIKSYLSNIIYPFKQLVTRVIRENEVFPTENLFGYKINEMSYFEFYEWARARINYDVKNYIKSEEFYSFSLICNRYLVNDNLLECLKPIYPWKKSIIDSFRIKEISDIIRDKMIEEKNIIIKNKDEEIKKLNDELKKLKEFKK